MRPTLVTGAGGFIAGNLIPRLLAAGHHVVAVIRPGGSAAPETSFPGQLTVAECDLADPTVVGTVVERYRPSAIVNLAVSRASDVHHSRGVNSVGVGALVEAASAIDAYLVHAGSSTEYGMHDRPLGPDTQCRPSSALGVTKLEACRKVSAEIRRGRLRGCVLRIFHAYGAGEPAGRLVPRALHAARSGDPLPLTPPGAGHDLIDVADVVSAILACIDTGLTVAQPIDVCTGTCILNEAVADIVEAETGQPIDRRVGGFASRDWDRPIWTGDGAALTAILGRPPRSLPEGIRALLHTSSAESCR